MTRDPRRAFEALASSGQELATAVRDRNVDAVQVLVRERGEWLDTLVRGRDRLAAEERQLVARLNIENTNAIRELTALRDGAAAEIARIRRSRSIAHSNRSASAGSRFVSERC